MMLLMVSEIITGIQLHERLGIEKYELVAKGLRWNGPKEMEKALEATVPMRGATIVDVGCGTGQLCNLFDWHAAGKVIAVDGVAEYVIHLIKTKRAKSGIHVDISKDKLQLPNETADLVTASGLFTYIADPAHAISEMVRVTKPGGHIAVNFHPSENPLVKREERVSAASLTTGMRAPVYNMYHHATGEIMGLFDSMGTVPVHQSMTTQGVQRMGPTEQWLPLTTCVFRKTP